MQRQMNKLDINAISNGVGVLELFMAMRLVSLVTQNVVTQNMSPKNVMGPVNSLLMAYGKVCSIFISFGGS